jgi:hypothetical protein
MFSQRVQRRQATSAGSLLCCAILLAGGWAGRGGTAKASSEAPAQKPAAVGAQKATTPAPAKPLRAAGATGRVAPTPAERPASAGSKHPGGSFANRRDPFRVPPPSLPVSAATMSGPLPAGPKGLIISQLILEGIVRMDATGQMIAVVTNSTRRAYFLRENDELYNGVVSKITPEAVYFKAKDLDENGRVTTAEVVKRLGPPPGEGR